MDVIFVVCTGCNALFSQIAEYPIALVLCYFEYISLLFCSMFLATFPSVSLETKIRDILRLFHDKYFTCPRILTALCYNFRFISKTYFLDLVLKNALNTKVNAQQQDKL